MIGDKVSIILAEASLKKTMLFILLPILFVGIWIISEKYGQKIDKSIFYYIFGNYLPLVFYVCMLLATCYYVNIFIYRKKYLEIRDGYLYIANIKRCNLNDICSVVIKKKINSVIYLRIVTPKNIFVINSLICLDDLGIVKERILKYASNAK